MADKQELEIQIDDAGNVTIKVIGAEGPTCLKLTKELEEALGVVVERQRTSDYYRADTAAQQNLEQGQG